MAKTQLLPAKAASSSQPSSSSTERIECLYACVAAVKDWFAVFLPISPRVYAHLPLAVFSQMSHCVAAVFRLANIEDPAWDRAAVADTINMVGIVSSMGEKMEEAAELCREAGDDAHAEMFIMSLAAIRKSTHLWNSTLSERPQGAVEVPSRSAGDVSGPPPQRGGASSGQAGPGLSPVPVPGEPQHAPQHVSPPPLGMGWGDGDVTMFDWGGDSWLGTVFGWQMEP